MGRRLVTVGITAFNAVDTIERAVQTALAQSWDPTEIIAVDDCSTDGTYEVLAGLAASRANLHVFRNPTNLGVAATRNRIISGAHGEFVAFFDDDDQSHPERISAQVERIVDYEREFAQGSPVICHTARRVLYPDGSVRIEPTMGDQEVQAAPSGIRVAERILLGASLKNGYGACPTCSQMARLSTYKLLGGFHHEFRRCEDSELNIRLAKLGGHFIGIAEPLVDQTMTKTSDKSLLEEHRYMMLLLEKHRDVPDKYKMYQFCRCWLEMKQAWLAGQGFLFARRFIGLAMTHPWLTVQRAALALPNIGLNRAFRRFHVSGSI
jgi:glycosyltransferase involved in cell wall biosynthesis